MLANPDLHDIIPFVRQWYADASRFIWRGDEGVAHEILQGDGGEQGDALMPALFCLGLLPALREIQEGLPEGAYVFAYLDDIYVVCERDDVHLIFHRIREILTRACHIDINMGKLKAWSKAETDSPPGLDTISPNAWKADAPDHQRGIEILGTPIGSRAFVEACATEAIQEKAQLLNFLPKLPSRQASWLLLYFCAVPRINHLLRTVSPDLVQGFAERHDVSMLEAFRDVFGIGDETSWNANLQQVEYQV